jgi:hypothetical protein
MNTFDDVWLSRYPRPEYICFDNEGEYKNVFEELVNNYGIKKKNSIPFNPQSTSQSRLLTATNALIMTSYYTNVDTPPCSRDYLYWFKLGVLGHLRCLDCIRARLGRIFI